MAQPPLGRGESYGTHKLTAADAERAGDVA